MNLFTSKNKQLSPSHNEEELFLKNISPIDGRYRGKLESLSKYFSEYGYIKYRVTVEIQYLIFLSDIENIFSLSQSQILMLQEIYSSFSIKDAIEIKKYEKEINHDMKAIEYFLQKKCIDFKLPHIVPYIHWGITSDDTGNLAYSMALNEFSKEHLIPSLQGLITLLKSIAIQYKKSPLLARTHGQPAVPTTFGKEIHNFYARLQKHALLLEKHSFEGKLMGAVGTLAAHRFAFPKVNWVQKSSKFVRSLGLSPNVHVTQILPGDSWVTYFQILGNINSIIRGLSQDMWIYIMQEEVCLKKKEGEVGSSTMPQKVNPIDFENAEGNCEIANSYFQLYERELLSSRLQRDLSDSVLKRTFGTALSHTLLAWTSLQRGMNKIEFNSSTAQQHLNDHYEILGEVIQTQLRLKNETQGYETVKKLLRGKKITKKIFQSIVQEVGIENLENLTPETYVGYAEELVASD